MKHITETTGGVDSAILRQYVRDGFLILRNFFRFDEELLDCFSKVLKKYTGITLEQGAKYWTSDELHEAMISLRINSPREFGLMYDEMNLKYSLHKIFYDDRLSDIVSSLMFIDRNDLVLTGQMLRLDSPVDDRNALKWHQDSSYYIQNRGEDTGLVIWCPIVNVNKRNGTLQMIPGSHKVGEIKVPSQTFGPNSSEQFEINERDLENIGLTQAVDFNAAPGDVGLFHMNLVHKSGTNKSGKFRIIAGCRAHNSRSRNFQVGKMNYFLSQSIQSMRSG